ncbi:hypothetical protein J2X11_000368 [Aeromicrobium panaciterrae]|uniref:Secreted protein n=1 Tax=Aeromicrobium panaciterrae TaxID=363861 RepID=A0ABU1UK23_9ACTN|nr:DUF6049 family protein [Aeromicrobium panaciterrae]MDR7085529.1 hypothetical protein [Aeromicrobium panaciterrae]
MSSHRRRISMALLTTIVATLLVSAPSQAADKDPDLAVTITTLKPSFLKAGSDVTVRGTITNNDDHPWRKVQAYLVIPTNPFTTRAQLDDAIANGAANSGTRVIETGAYDELGTLAPGRSVAFQVKVPHEQLGISGSAGVYPMGVQVLGTDTDGSRSNDAIAAATTFLPSIAPGQKPVPTTVVWPFLVPDYRAADGNYHDPLATLTSIGAGGQLRNLLDLAKSLPPRSSTVLLDPALLVGIDDIANKRLIAKKVELTDLQASQAERFLQELLAYVRSQNVWILGFDRPDVLALTDNPDLRRGLTAAVDTATRSALTTYQLTGRRVTWPTKNGATAGLLRAERRDGETPLIVTPSSVPGWERRLGSIVSYESASGPIPLLVNDVIANVPGGSSVVSLRQRILSDAALAGLQRALDPTSRADAVTMVDPTWNPGPRPTTGGLASVFSSPFTSGSTLDDVLTRQVSKYSGRVPAKSTARTVSRAQLQAASDLSKAGDALTSIVTDDDQSVDATYSREVAGLLGVRWRSDPPLGISVANNLASRAVAEMAKIKIEGPPSVTLSSSSGGFPLTIINETSYDLRVGIDLDSSNPALDVPSVKPVNIAAGERQTLTVNIDLGQQSTTQLTAKLVSSGGAVIAESKAFNVRSSQIGVVLWVAIGLAGVLVLVALFRRFHRRRTGSSTTERLADDD